MSSFRSLIRCSVDCSSAFVGRYCSDALYIDVMCHSEPYPATRQYEQLAAGLPGLKESRVCMCVRPTMDGRNPEPLEKCGKPLFVGMYRRILIPGFLRWCEMDFATIHQYCSRPVEWLRRSGSQLCPLVFWKMAVALSPLKIL